MNKLIQAIASEYADVIIKNYCIDKPADIKEIKELYSRLFSFEMKKTYKLFLKDRMKV